MNSRYGLFNLEKGFIFTTLLISQLFLGACSNSTDVTQNSGSQSVDSQSQTTAIELNTDIKESQSSLAANSSSQSHTKFKPSFTDDNSSVTYIAPETLIEDLNNPVNDFTSTLSTAELEYLNQKIRDVYEEGLLQIGIVIVATTEDMPIFDYAMTVAKSWALGSPENNNGTLILMALDDKEIYILTGLDIEDKLTDDRVASVIDKDITPHFRKANYVTGLSAGIDALVWNMRQY